jgi:hypothetical protein
MSMRPDPSSQPGGTHKAHLPDLVPQHSGPSRIPPAAPVVPVSPPAVHNPAILHQPHSDSKLCQDYHWVPYPLGLMPFDSWHKLHHPEDVHPSLPFRCPVCRKERKATVHLRKLFLVAERLSWAFKTVSSRDRDLNEELNWKVNYELGILDPFVEDSEQIAGGRNSRSNKMYPYKNEHEMRLALGLIFTSEDLKETTWALWISNQLNLQRVLGHDQQLKPSPGALGPAPALRVNEKTLVKAPTRPKPPDPTDMIDLTGSPEPSPKPANRKLHGLSTPPLPLRVAIRSPRKRGVLGMGSKQHKYISPYPAVFVSTAGPVATPPPPPKCIQSYKSLQDFYSLLDMIERTSHVGALYLEAYAEKLRDDMCKDCWRKHNIRFDLY